MSRGMQSRQWRRREIRHELMGSSGIKEADMSDPALLQPCFPKHFEAGRPGGQSKQPGIATDSVHGADAVIRRTEGHRLQQPLSWNGGAEVLLERRRNDGRVYRPCLKAKRLPLRQVQTAHE